MMDSAIDIFYLGESEEYTTSKHRAHALQRLGHRVVHIDPSLALNRRLSGRLRGAIHFRSGYRLLQNDVLGLINSQLALHPLPQVAWIDSGELLGPACLNAFVSRGIPRVLFNHDDPTGKRDGRRFDMLRESLPLYDVSVAVREESLVEYKALGAPNVIQCWRTYDEMAHRPFSNAQEIPIEYRSDVAFIGTWMPGENRDEFIATLLQSGIKVSIWGERWDRSPVWGELKTSWRGPGLGGRSYVAAIQGAKICLGLLSRQNRDRHTTRSMEIPYAGGLLCAQRTDDHLRLYEENTEAVFWSNVTECVEKCKWLLSDDDARESIRLAGMKRVRQNKVGNEDLCRRVLASIGFSSSASDDARASLDTTKVANTKSGP